jgi:hypothetical protein
MQMPDAALLRRRGDAQRRLGIDQAARLTEPELLSPLADLAGVA